MASSHSTPDPLFEMKNSFYLGNFQSAINGANKTSVQDANQKIEKDIFMYRSFLAQKKYAVVLDEIRVSSSKQMQPIKILAEYLSAGSAARNKIASDLDKAIVNVDPSDDIYLLIAATIYYYEQNYDAALRLLQNVDNLECSAMCLQIYLKLDRLDLARKELKRMQEKDEDATLTQLSQAWVNIALGGEKLQEAFFIFQELSDKYGSTALLLNGQAVALICQGKYAEAEQLIQEAQEKDSNNAETLINSIVLSHYLGKSPEVSNRYLSQLKDSNPNDQFVADIIAKENEMDRLVKLYAPVH